jgi:hypothetical protein
VDFHVEKLDTVWEFAPKGDPNFATAFALLALSYCRPQEAQIVQ